MVGRYLILLAVAVAGLAGGWLLADRTGSSSGTDEPACEAEGDFTQMIDRYKAGEFAAREDAGGLEIGFPDPQVSAEGRAQDLPIGPCQTIYRFEYLRLADGPFRYAEIDWNTEGIPRGPNDSFVSPHYDFHFYLWPRQRVDDEMTCESSNGRTCDPALTAYDQTRRFLDLPEPAELPETYRPDIDSSIPEMGLHHLDFSEPYTVDYVDHTPTLLYGSFDGEIAFLEASVTPTTLRDASQSAEGQVSFELAKPERCPAGEWPTRFVVAEEDDGSFSVRFDRLRACST